MFILPIQEGNPPKKFPLINALLITGNIYVFFKTFFLPNYEQYIFAHGFIPAHPHFQNVLSSMFLHAGFGHLLGNMYFLYVFGDKVEERLGKLNYLFAYLLSGLGACYLQYSVNPHSTLPMIGASGAISGICALYMMMFPWQKMRLQFFILIFPIFSIPARAFFVVGIWFLEQYFMATHVDPAMGGVAFWAHVGGFFTGILLFTLFYSGNKPRS
ncbi:MAG TPA: rhomboid family intramembrane serine protease [bacterium]|nr:rhomboid family intramembrane serine protease [bacterium]